MFILWCSLLLTCYSAEHTAAYDDDELDLAEFQRLKLVADNSERIRCRDMSDIEELCEHQKQCLDVMPDLPKLCRSFKKEKYGLDEFVEIIDSRRSDTFVIQMIADMVSYNDASPPVIIQGPKNLTVAPGYAYQLECKAEGAPTPKLTITRREEASLKKSRSKGSDMEVQMSAAHVIHKNERVQLGDEGWYRCVASNSRGAVYSDAYLRVYDLCGDITCTGGKVCVPNNEEGTASCLCPECIDMTFAPTCGSDCVTHFNPCQLEYKNCLYGTEYTRFLEGNFCPKFDPPVISLPPPSEVDVIEGKKFALTCKASPSGDSPGPTPIISWYRAEMVPTEDPMDMAPTELMPDYNGGKLGDGEVIKLRSDEDMALYCVAHQCKHGQNVPIDVVSNKVRVFVAPPQLNLWMGGPSCQIFGDPHVITFDKASYDFEGQCEYVLSMDCGRKWSIYGGFEPCSTHGRGSCLSSVTLNFNKDIRIELMRGLVINNAGERIVLALSEAKHIIGKDGTGIYVKNFGEWLVVKFNNGYELRWDGLMSAQVLLGKDFSTTCGLCGNANGDAEDDFRIRRSDEVTKNVAKFGDSWKIDRRNKCILTSTMSEWEWDKEFGDKRDEAEQVCARMFESPQLSTCGNGWEKDFPDRVNPAPYRKACIADYMRSDFMPDGMTGQNVACIAAFNYAERCGNVGTKNHLWREQTGCAGEDEELMEYLSFVGDLGCK